MNIPKILAESSQNETKFMNATRTTKITLRTSESRYIRSGGEKLAYCNGCQSLNSHFPVIQIAALLGISEKALFRLVEDGHLHSAETQEGWLLICSGCAGRIRDCESEREEVLTLGEGLI